MNAARCQLLVLIVTALYSTTGVAALNWSEFRIERIFRLSRHPRGPQYPLSYQVSYNFTLPYERAYLQDGLTVPVKVWRDDRAKKVRIDTYGGVNSLIGTEQVSWEVFPKIDKVACAKVEPDPGEWGPLSIHVLPDISDWGYKGKDKLHGQHVHLWEYSKRHGDKHTVYKWYADSEGNPIRLHMHGNDVYSGAHFDIYVVDYYDYKPGFQDSTIFDTPKECENAEPAGFLSSFSAQVQALMPHVHKGSAIPNLQGFLAGLRPSLANSEAEQSAFLSNAALIQAHNTDPAQSYKMELNKFSAWSQEEFEAVMLPRHRQPRGLVARSGGGQTAAIPYERLAPKGNLPTAVDWRGSLVDEVVKDQAACGSCWSFAATGTLEAAYHLATGKKRLFSEQQMMDCSWGHGLNKACDGGDYDAAMDYLKYNGGLVAEKDYEYLGADAFCRDKSIASSEKTQFLGYAYVPQHDDEALMEAVYSRGPIAVSLDASVPGFRFYSEGILDDPRCKWKSDDLDHAVLLVGYGTCPVTGKDYWLIRNSWSTYWGDKGYIKIARGHHGCGITTDPVYAVFNSTR